MAKTQSEIHKELDTFTKFNIMRNIVHSKYTE